MQDLVPIYTLIRSRISRVLFFCCADDPRHLHSFPTRRSSDLAALSPAARLLPRHRPAVRGRVRARRAVARDRKSTRLNSSHGYISYAVFCLKKTTTNNEATNFD